MNLTRTTRRGLRLVLPAAVAVALLVTISPVRAEPAETAGDTVVVVVSAKSPVTRISRLHLADLYMGRTTRFPDGKPATPIDQKAGTLVRATFSEVYLGRSEAQMKSYWSRLIFTGRGRPPREAASGEAMKDLVARDPRAIGYIDARLLDASVRRVRVE